MATYPLMLNKMLHEVDLNSLDVSNLLWDIQKTCVSSEDVEDLWEIKQVWLVRNKKLEDRYEEKRKLMKSLGRTDEETQDDLLFTAEGQHNVQLICESGPRCQEKKNNVLGDTQYGIHMSRHYDILTKFMVFKNFQQANFIVILRAMLGRVKKVKPFLTGEYGCIAPTPNYDCHIAEDDLDLTSMDLTDAIAYNFAYMYEYDEESILPMDYPRHVLPIAVLRLYRTRNRLIRPVYMRERDLQKIKKKRRLQNETKPMKHLPKLAPHKKYIEEGRRHGTKLISDVPIEPASEKPPSETTKKLEKFRRPSSVSGGTGLGYLFFKRPFIQMPSTWKKMFRFRSKKKSRKAQPKQSTKRRRSLSSSREPRHRQRSRSRSPLLTSSKSREKNLFEIFDRSSPDRISSISSPNRTKASAGKVLREKASNDRITHKSPSARVANKIPSVSSIDTGCKNNEKTVSKHGIPKDNERICDPVHKGVSSNRERGIDSGSNGKPSSEPWKMCNDKTNNAQGMVDGHRKRSSEFSYFHTSESTKTSIEGSHKKETVKGDLTTHEKTVSSKQQDTKKDQKYHLVRITFDYPDTPSIYHVSRGICIPKEDKKKVKDPRLLRAMGCVVEVPVMAGFGPFLRRIKEEPPDDEKYGQSSEKMKNILPIESIKAEPEDEEDDVEKVLKELNNAIKAIQNKSIDETLGSMDKNKKGVMDSCENGEYQIEVKKEPEDQNQTDTGQEHRTDDFHPRNMGFSSYLPEYNEKNDFERTARVLTEVFAEGETSPNKKLPMTMSDYFGSSNPNVSLNTTNETNIEHQLSDINMSCEPTSNEHLFKENQDKKINSDEKCQTKLSAKRKSSENLSESKMENKRNVMDSVRSTAKNKKPDRKNNITADKRKTEKSYTHNYRESSKKRSRSRSPRPRTRLPSTSHVHKRKPDIKRSSSGSVSKNDKDLDNNKQFSKKRSRSRSPRPRSRSLSPSVSEVHKRRQDVKRKRNRSGSVGKNDKGLDRPKSHSAKKKRVETRSTRSPHSRSRSRPDLNNSRERRSKSKSSPVRSRSCSSLESETRYKPTSASQISDDSAWKSKPQEEYDRENSPGRIKYLEERRINDQLGTRRYQTPDIVSHYKRVYGRRTEESNNSPPRDFTSTSVKSDDDMDFYDNHRSSYIDLTKEAEFQRLSEKRPASTNDEAVVNTTLSKAMTSLLKKIVFRDNSNRDDSAEGRMADMVIELVKDQMSKEIKPILIPTAGVSTSSIHTPTVHPFVPYLKQERNMEDLYGSNPWEPTVSSSRSEMSNGRVEYTDDYLNEPYQHDSTPSIPSTSYSYRSRGSPYMERVQSSYPLSDGYIDPHSGAFKGKLYTMKTLRKIRGGSYRGRFNSSRGSFHPRARARGFRGGYRSRGRGHPSHTVSSFRHSYQDKRSYDEER